MTPEELAALARESGLAALADTSNPMYANGRLLAYFAALVAEQCALTCEARAHAAFGPHLGDAAWGFEACASAIRTAFPMPKKDTPT